MPRVPDRGRDRRVGHRDHDVGVDARLACQLDAEPLADVVDVVPVPHRVGPREVHELERAARRLGGGCQRLVAAHLGALQGDDLAGLDLVDVGAAERRQGARLAGDGVAAVREPPDRQRPEAPRVADGDHLVLGQQHQRERALPRRQRALEALLPGAPAGGGEHQRDHLGVAGGGEAEAAREQLVAQRRGVDDVAVVGDGQRAVHRLDEERLDVALGVRAGGRVAGVADRVVAGERRQHGRREHVGDEPLVLVQPRPLPVADGDARPPPARDAATRTTRRTSSRRRRRRAASRSPITPHSSRGCRRRGDVHWLLAWWSQKTCFREVGDEAIGDGVAPGLERRCR